MADRRGLRDEAVVRLKGKPTLFNNYLFPDPTPASTLVPAGRGIVLESAEELGSLSTLDVQSALGRTFPKLEERFDAWYGAVVVGNGGEGAGDDFVAAAPAGGRGSMTMAEELFWTETFFSPPISQGKTALRKLLGRDFSAYVRVALFFSYLKFKAVSQEERDYIDTVLELPDTEDGDQRLSQAYANSPAPYAQRHAALKESAILQRALNLRRTTRSKVLTCENTPLWSGAESGLVLNTLTRLALHRALRALDPDERAKLAQLAVTRIYESPEVAEETEGERLGADAEVAGGGDLDYLRCLASINARCAFDSNRTELYMGVPVSQAYDRNPKFENAIFPATFDSVMPFPAVEDISVQEEVGKAMRSLAEKELKDDDTSIHNEVEKAMQLLAEEESDKQLRVKEPRKRGGLLEFDNSDEDSEPDAGNAPLVSFVKTSVANVGMIEIDRRPGQDARQLIAPLPLSSSSIAESREDSSTTLRLVDSLYSLTTVVSPMQASSTLQYTFIPEEEDNRLFGMPFSGKQIKMILRHTHPVLKTVIPPPKPTNRRRVEPGEIENEDFLEVLDLISGFTPRYITKEGCLVKLATGCSETAGGGYDCSTSDSMWLIKPSEAEATERSANETDLANVGPTKTFRTTNEDEYRILYFEPCGSTQDESSIQPERDPESDDDESEVADDGGSDYEEESEPESDESESVSEGESEEDDLVGATSEPPPPRKRVQRELETDEKPQPPRGAGPLRAPRLPKRKGFRPKGLNAPRAYLTPGTRRAYQQPRRKIPPKKLAMVGEFADDTIWVAKPTDGSDGYVGVVEREGNYFIIYAFTTQETNETTTWSNASDLWVRTFASPVVGTPSAFPAVPSLEPPPRFATQLPRDCQLELIMVGDDKAVAVPPPREWLPPPQEYGMPPEPITRVFHFTPATGKDAVKYLSRLDTAVLKKLLERLSGESETTLTIEEANEKFARLFCYPSAKHNTEEFEYFVFKALEQYRQTVGTLPVLEKMESPDTNTAWYWLFKSTGDGKGLIQKPNAVANLGRNVLHKSATYRRNPLEYIGAAIQLLWYSKFFKEQQRQLVGSFAESSDSSKVYFRVRRKCLDHIETIPPLPAPGQEYTARAYPVSSSFTRAYTAPGYQREILRLPDTAERTVILAPEDAECQTQWDPLTQKEVEGSGLQPGMVIDEIRAVPGGEYLLLSVKSPEEDWKRAFYPGGIEFNTEFTGFSNWFELTANQMFITAGRAELAEAQKNGVKLNPMDPSPVSLLSALANNTPCTRVPRAEWFPKSKTDWEKGDAGAQLFSTQYENSGNITVITVYMSVANQANFVDFLKKLFPPLKQTADGTYYYVVNGKQHNVRITTKQKLSINVPLGTNVEEGKRGLEGFQETSAPKRRTAEAANYATKKTKLERLRQKYRVGIVQIIFSGTRRLSEDNKDALLDFIDTLKLNINKDARYYTSTELIGIDVPDCTLWEHTLLHLGQSKQVLVEGTLVENYDVFEKLKALPIIGTDIERIDRRLHDLKDQGVIFANEHELTLIYPPS